MRTSTLLLRNLTYFWRTNLAVIAGVATAVAVLAGALLVGDSVRASLRDLVLSRLGAADDVIASTGFFRDKLAEELESQPDFAREFAADCPMIVLRGFVTHEKSGRRASGVQVYGVDDRFWKFHRRGSAGTSRGEREILLSPDLARELGSQQGETILLRVEKPSAIPAGSLHGRKDDLGRTIRLTAADSSGAGAIAEFSLQPRQGEVRAAFVSLSRLQKDIDRQGRVNTLLLAEKTGDSGKQPSAPRQSLIAQTLQQTFSLEDVGLKLRVLDERRGIAVESESAIVSDELYGQVEEAARKSNVDVVPVLSYLANSIRVGDHDVPYSLVTALGTDAFEQLSQHSGKGGGTVDSGASVGGAQLPAIILNEWAAADLSAKPGDVVTLEYYVWEDEGKLDTRSTQFRLVAVVPVEGPAADRDLVPDYPGITQTENISDWDPPFPVDLKRVRPKDEDYWHKYRTTPKSFVQLQTGVHLWQSSHGKYTSLRVHRAGDANPRTYLDAFQNALRETLNPMTVGFSVSPVRAAGLQASQGATDFGEYFVYFSFFLVVAALLLASLFFKLGIEQRLREIGLLRAIGFSSAKLRSLFLREGVLLSVAGSLLGVPGAVGYGALMIEGLRTWWSGAVGTTSLRLGVSPLSLVIGAGAGIIVGMACIVWTLRRLVPASPAVLLAGNLEAAMNLSSAKSAAGTGVPRKQFITSGRSAIALTIIGLLLLAGAKTSVIGETAGFFGAGSSLLAALLCFEHGWLRNRTKRVIRGSGWWPISRLGFRNATYRPGRSILCIALIASAAFVIVAVDSFKRDVVVASTDKKSGTGGFPLLAESLFPLYYDPNTPEGKEQLGIFANDNFDPSVVSFNRFRVRQGDDASCLNLYQPRNPRILAPEPRFIESGRFSFQSSLGKTKESRSNPWLLLNETYPDGEVPVIADANSLTYVLHRGLGEDIILSSSDGDPIRLKVVAALSDSIFQGELIMSEQNFQRLFPQNGGYSFFLLDVPASATETVTGALESQLSDFGFDIVPTGERLAGFHRVEDTYISTFQALGGLGLVLGTLGLAAVLLRNVLERRKELAVLRAIGYDSNHFAWMVISENAFLVACGLLTGVVCAVVAVIPALSSRGGQLPVVSFWLLLLVMVTGLFASVAATVASLRAPLIPSLRAE